MKTQLFQREYCFGFNVPYACRAICPDGIVRKVRTAIEPDTYFSLPARGTIGGYAITGYVAAEDDGEYFFRIHTNHKNYDAVMAYMARES